MQWVLLRAVDDSRFSVSRKAHRLSPVEFRVLKRSQAKQTISKRGRRVLPSNIDLIRENQLQALRQRLKDSRLIMARRRRSPRPVIILISHSHRHSDDSSHGFRIADQSFDLRPTDFSQSRQKRPLVCIWLELLVDKDGISPLPRLLLQRQCNQISKPSFGHSVLIRKKSIIGAETDLRTTLHRLGENM